MDGQAVPESCESGTCSMADAYFDILAHDVTDLISPIMVHAEFIALQGELPGEARSSAAKIVRQIRRTANFILSFRMLHEAASSPPTEPAAFDLHGLAETIQENVPAEYPSRRASVVVGTCAEGPVMFPGAEFVGRIVTGLVDNAIRNATRPEVEVVLSLSEVELGDGRRAWRCEVIDDGPGVPDSVKNRLMRSFEASTGLTRGSPSSLMFYSAILGHMGGALRIDDRVPGEMGKGTRVVVEVPSTPRREC